MSIALFTALLSLLLALAFAVWIIYTILYRKSRLQAPLYGLSRHKDNPVISPQRHIDWEADGTFNPAAVSDDEGKVHLFYRAIGKDGMSRIGYASSRDGKRFVDRSPYPVFNPTLGYGMPADGPHPEERCYDIVKHPSGGGWSGCEDPRTVRIDDRVYMTYMAFEGWDNMRIAVTSIATDDLKKRIWRWKRPVFLSPPKKRNKNWVLFPEKIGGKFAILHGLTPNIMIDYVDSIDDFYGKRHIVSAADHGGWGHYDDARKGLWDHRMKGTGAPPILTDIGWLVLYHAIVEDDRTGLTKGYNVGAMILDRNDPVKILYRSPTPILSPHADYENDGKPGIAYATGSIVKNGNLIIYYGGGDKHVCVAETPLKPLLDWLVAYGKV